MNRRPFGIFVEIRDLERNVPIYRGHNNDNPEKVLRDAHRFLRQGLDAAIPPMPQPLNESLEEQLERVDRQIRANLEISHHRRKR